jgi:sugar phosphate isomerase/epimerase
MGKIILEFDSDEERNDARTALDAYKWKGAVWDLDQKLREITKYGFVDKIEATDQERDLAEKLRKELRGILEDYNLNLDE